MWRIVRFLSRLVRRLAWWQKLTALVCAPLLSLNLAVAFFGESAVFPLSPFFLQEKWTALTLYAKHRPRCLLQGHGDAGALAEASERRYGLPAGLMRAVVEVESGTRPHRISFAGAMGPAQLMAGTAAALGVSDPFDSAQAIDAGARYLAHQLQRTGDVRLAVAAYNAGPGNVSGAVPRNGETEVYVARVMRRFSGAR